MQMLEYKEGHNRYFIEVNNNIVVPQIQNKVAKRAATSTKGIVTEKLSDIKKDFFSDIGAFISKVSNEIVDEINQIPSKPNELEVEFNLDASVQGDICVVSSEVRSMIKVKMKWTPDN